MKWLVRYQVYKPRFFSSIRIDGTGIYEGETREEGYKNAEADAKKHSRSGVITTIIDIEPLDI